MSKDGDIRICANCGKEIAFDEPYGDWFHTGRDSSPDDLFCVGTSGDEAEPTETKFQCYNCGKTFDYGEERGICDGCIDPKIETA